MLTIPKDLLDTLHDLRVRQLQYPYPGDFTLNNPVVVLTLGLGAELYLGFDGRVFKRDFLDEDGPVYETKDMRDIAAGITIAARSNHIPELRDLLPSCPPDGTKCPDCRGIGTLSFDEDVWVVCACHGLGWQAAS